MIDPKTVAPTETFDHHYTGRTKIEKGIQYVQISYRFNVPNFKGECPPHYMWVPLDRLPTEPENLG